MHQTIDSTNEKDAPMTTDRRRILELALESLESKKRALDVEIAQITRELRGRTVKPATSPEPKVSSKRKGPRFSEEEKQKRSLRMTAYWAKRRKEKVGQQ
jgi:hypothetical protein